MEIRKIASNILDTYPSVFAKKRFYSLNLFFYYLGLRGLGVLNFKNNFISGEKNLLIRFKKDLNDINAVIFDVGANQGDYSKMIRDLIPKSRIYAFEPHPNTFIKLKKNTSKLKRINIRNIGFSSKGQISYIYDCTNNDGSEFASLYKGVIEDIHKSKSVKHKIILDTIDDFCGNEKINNIDFLKIDTEGHELDVIKGAKKMIQKKAIKIIQFEFNEMNSVSRVFMDDFFSNLKNYKLYRALPTELLLIEHIPVISEIYAYQNIVAILNDPKINL